MKTLYFSFFVLIMSCGEDTNNAVNPNNSSEDECTFSGEFTGAAEDELSLSEKFCGASNSGSTITINFGPFDGRGVSFGFVGLSAGQTDGEIDSFVTYRNTMAQEWNANDCLATFSRNEKVESDPDFGDKYALTGTIDCTSPAVPRSGGAEGEVTVSSVSFKAIVPFL